MPVNLPPKASSNESVSPNGVLARILNWTAVAVCVGLCWWAVTLLR
jgi:hypothetical protein